MGRNLGKDEVFVPGELLVDTTAVNVGGAVGSGSALLTGRQTARDFQVSATGFTSPKVSHIVAAGTAITTGTELFAQNGFPVVAIEGDPSTLPALNRTLTASSSDGIDIKLFEAMLHAGNFDKAAPLTIDHRPASRYPPSTGVAVPATRFENE